MTSALEYVGGQRHTLATSSPGNKRGIHFTGGWFNLRVGLGGSKKSCPPHRLNPRPPSQQKVSMLAMLLCRPFNMNRICKIRIGYGNKIYT